MGKELGPFAHEVIAPAHQIPRGPHLLRADDVGHGDQPSSRQGGDLLGVDLVVLALAAVDGPHVERMPEEKGLFSEQRSASQRQEHMHSAQTIRSSDKGRWF